ncbi:MAG: hypothetical protein HY918_05880 [Candidatus Doudnabacteria bacterium]|nr:hypothetical protein [Candidatus Doudnabacteria bacterium]
MGATANTGLQPVPPETAILASPQEPVETIQPWPPQGEQVENDDESGFFADGKVH